RSKIKLLPDGIPPEDYLSNLRKELPDSINIGKIRCVLADYEF
ncbi:MAG: hypothetical protein ABEH43_02255, partial [Flavobacteriales bacterium]